MWTLAIIAVLCGAPWLLVGAAVLVAVTPMPGMVALVAVGAIAGIRARRRQAKGRSEVTFLRSVASTVAAGGTLRDGVVASGLAGSHVLRLCKAGASMTDIGVAASRDLLVNGRAFASLCAMSEQTGSSVAASITSLATRAAKRESRERRKRVSLAQVRFSALIVGVAPLALTTVITAARGIPEPGGAAVIIPMMVGAALEILGTTIVFRMSVRPQR